jgi:transcription elongation factor GreA
LEKSPKISQDLALGKGIFGLILMEKILLTRMGYEKLLKELEFLSQVERPQVVRELLEAAQDGGVEKNPDFQSVLAQRQRLEWRIKQLKQILANAEVLVGSNLPPNQVRFNSLVRVLNLSTGREQQFKMVGPVEADASKGNLSISSPLGRALLGQAPGVLVRVQTPSGSRTYQILAVQMDEP